MRIKRFFLIPCLWIAALFIAACSPAPSAGPTPVPTAIPMAATPEATAFIAPTAPPAADPLAARDGVYSFGWISDTQYYSHSYPDIFHCMTEFLYSERERLNLQYVIHTGDLVSWSDREEDWIVAAHAMRALHEIPYGVLAGNHDVTRYGKGDAVDYAIFAQYFGEAQIPQSSLTADVFEDNRGHVDLVDAGKTRYAFVYLGFPIRAAGIDWANEQFSKYRDRVGVLCLHSYFNADLTYTDQGERAFSDIVEKNDNLYLVLCGHRYNCRTVPIKVQNSDGSTRTVLQSIANYQAAGKEGGSGYVRMIQVDEQSGTLRLISYSPLLDNYGFYDDSENLSDPYYFDPAGEDETIPIPWIQPVA